MPVPLNVRRLWATCGAAADARGARAPTATAPPYGGEIGAIVLFRLGGDYEADVDALDRSVAGHVATDGAAQPPAGLADRAVLWLAAAVLVAMRSHVAGAALEADECNYLYVASRLLAGDRLYVDVWDHQPPGVFWMFAALLRVFGDSAAVLRWTATACSLVSLCFLFDVARRCFGRSAAWLTAVFFAIGSANPTMAGEGGNREVYMNALAAAAMWSLLRTPALSAPAVAAAGLCWGLASLLKTVAAAQWLGVLVFLLLAGRAGGFFVRQTSAPWRRAALFAAGPAILWAATAAGYAATGRLGPFADAVFAFNVGYGESAESWWLRWVALFRAERSVIFLSSWPVWLGGSVGAVLCLLRRGSRSPASFAWVCYALGSYLAVCLPGRFWPHYYLLLWQPLAVLVAVLGAELSHMFKSERSQRRSATLFGVGVSAVLAWQQLDRYLLVAPENVGSVRYRWRMEWAREQAAPVAGITGPRETIYVWGIDAGVYYYAGRRCASRYTMNTALKDEQPGREKRREQLLSDLKRNRPTLILLVDREFDGLAELLIERYYLVGEDRDPSNTDIVRARVFLREDRFDPDRVLPWPRPAGEPSAS